MTFLEGSIKRLFFLCLSAGMYFGAQAQCVLTAADDTQAEVLACLTACGCIEAQVPDGVTIDLAEPWDLTSAGTIQITIQGSGSLVFSGSGTNADEIIMAAGSQIIIEDITNTNALTGSGGLGNVRVTIGGTELDSNDFDEIIDNGGVDENFPAPPDTPLPVELVYFDGRRNLQGIVLTWQTATELNNDFFEIELSTDGESFKTIATIKGAGNSSLPIDYEWLHGSPVVGLNYYRLKQVDFNGDFEYFQTVLVQNDTAVPLFCSVYPTPADEILKLDIFSSNNELPLDLFIFDANGRVINSFPLEALERTVELNTTEINNGLYYFDLRQGRESFRGKILIQH